MIDYDAQNWLRIVVTTRGTVAPRMLGRIGIAIALGFVALWAHRNADVSVPPLAHTLIGVALGLLLVFRTNASYGRYIEARAILGRLVDASRDLARQVAASLPNDAEGRAARRDIARWIGAYYGLLVQDLRDEDRLDALGERLTASEREMLKPSKVRPAIVCLWITARIVGLHRTGRIDFHHWRMFDSNLTGMIGALGGCQRIRRTPVPFAYAQHIKVFLVLFCYTVPFVMVETLGLYTPIASAVLAFALFGIDEIGVEIEDPFGTDPNDLPMDRIGAVIEGSVREFVDAAESGTPASTVAAE